MSMRAKFLRSEAESSKKKTWVGWNLVVGFKEIGDIQIGSLDALNSENYGRNNGDLFGDEHVMVVEFGLGAGSGLV
ncbi:hypothetical protein LXL04_004397 [Taraxacum kok-saghyz]